MQIRNILCLTVILLVAFSTIVAAAPLLYAASPIEETDQSGRVLWNQSVIEAVGIGFPSAEATSAGQGRMLARRAAIVDAYRNLAETIQGVRVDAETTMQNLQITSDVVKTKVSGLIQGAKILREQAMADGSYKVVIAVNLYGEGSLADIALNQVKPDRIVDFPQAAAPQYSTGSPYTGVVVDARGLGLEATFSPRIYDENGRIIYGNMYIDTNLAISQGMVDYAPTAEMAQAAESGQSRAGSCPIVVKAIAVKDNNCNVVISNADAEKILQANQTGGFLRKLAIVFEN